MGACNDMDLATQMYQAAWGIKKGRLMLDCNLIKIHD